MRWEYKQHGLRSQNAEEEMNNLGSEGWELVSTILDGVGGFGSRPMVVAFFKRPVEEVVAPE
jgi:hypothetical protein